MFIAIAGKYNLFLSVFDIFKIGIGPSSSHTNGPMIATSMFLSHLKKAHDIVPGSKSFNRITCTLYGSLAFTGKGHSTDKAILLGIAGIVPNNFETSLVESIKEELHCTGHIKVHGFPAIKFHPDSDIIFDYGPPLKQHANGMIFRVVDEDGNLCTSKTFFSTGGGFVKTDSELENLKSEKDSQNVPYPF